MKGWQKDIFKGDYVRLITADEYRKRYYGNPDSANMSILKEYGGKVYRVQGCKYNGKIIMAEDEYHAYPPEYLQPWHKDEVDGDVSENDFTNLIGETL